MKSATWSTILLFAGIPFFCTCTEDLNRVVSGRVVHIKDHPFMVAFRKFNQTICGGSIISSNAVLTAAHCLKTYRESPEVFNVVVGATLSNGIGQVHDIAKAIPHPEFDIHNSYKNDVAVIKIKDTFHFGEKVQRIKLWSHSIPVGKMATISGWGLTAEGKQKDPAQPLKEAHVPIISNADCKEAYEPQGMKIRDTVFCAGFVKGGVDTCQGDSGGPIVYQHQQIGIVSYGIGCARAEFPGVYTNVAKYAHWIEKHI